jgi:hypothetical protein
MDKRYVWTGVSRDPVVLWCFGALVLWCSVALVLCCSVALLLWCCVLEKVFYTYPESLSDINLERTPFSHDDRKHERSPKQVAQQGASPSCNTR